MLFRSSDINCPFFVYRRMGGYLHPWAVSGWLQLMLKAWRGIHTLSIHLWSVLKMVQFKVLTSGLLSTGSADKMVKLWDVSNNEPSCVASRNPKATI
ncbi:uncharacterized protein LOC122079376 isoform X2 [Macadamia integrifolia]|uniref:uncharacterized protein LOC122079376 isoform X2 n=1 Tax=Macadamia integrifolia TaxID=60698 RepID=UPI001C4EC9EA|nr:uncharacterized protein LOC122079376 isoform X2 [Macadamia integrifolia]